MERNKGENVLVESVRNQKSVSIQKLLTEEDELCVCGRPPRAKRKRPRCERPCWCAWQQGGKVCVCLFHCHLPPDTAGKAANGGKGENELEGKKNRNGGGGERK